jgi:hypothetical protein
MATDFENMAVLLLMVLTIACLVQVVFVGVLLWYVKRMADFLGGTRGPVPLPPPPLPVPVPVPGVVEAPEAAVPKGAGPAGEPGAPAVEILRESPDIQGSIQRLSEKYGLSDLIITTLDGLVVVSLFPGSSDEAARFSDLYRRKKKPDSPNVTFFEIAHRGEAMLGVVRSDHPLSPEEKKGIDEDARKILLWWL